MNLKRTLIALAIAASAVCLCACGDSSSSLAGSTSSVAEDVELDVEIDDSTGKSIYRGDGSSEAAVNIKNGDATEFSGDVIDKVEYEQYLNAWQNASGLELKDGETDEGVSFIYYTTSNEKTDSGTETYFLIYLDDAQAGIIGSSLKDEETALSDFKALKLS